MKVEGEGFATLHNGKGEGKKRRERKSNILRSYANSNVFKKSLKVKKKAKHRQDL